MRNFVLSFCAAFFLLIFSSFAQPCFERFYSEGIVALDSLDFDKAIIKFTAAVECEDEPRRIPEAEQKLEEAKNNYIEALKKARDEARDGQTKIWDVKGNHLADLVQHSDAVYSVHFSSDGSKMTTASRDSTVYVWDFAGGPLADYKGHTAGVLSVCFSPDGQFILTASQDYSAKLWNLEGRCLADLPHDADVTAACFSGDGSQIITGTSTGVIRIWGFDGQLSVISDRHLRRIHALLPSPDGQGFLSASADGTAKRWATPRWIFNWVRKGGIVPR